MMIRQLSTRRPLPQYYCDVDAEPLDRYRKGGYHPTNLGDVFKDGRYKVMHKLGWGGYGTVWLAKDQSLHRYIALKLLVAESSIDSQEIRLLDRLSNQTSDHAGKTHIVHLWDHFQHQGPNGTHNCLVFELLGPNVVSRAARFRGDRLPAKIAWEACKQIAIALEYIHHHKVAHGDLHAGNVALVASQEAYQTSSAIMEALGTPERADVQAVPGAALDSHLPSYLVASASMPSTSTKARGCQFKIVDFGSSHTIGNRPQIRCPLFFRPPEALFDNEWGAEADIWSLGCTMFEFIVGHPPFDTIMANRDGLIREWVAMFGPLPDEWGHHLPSPGSSSEDLDEVTLSDWLHECYFDDDKPAGFAEAHIELVGDLLQSIMQYRPKDRLSISQILQHPWFEKNPFDA
ncbi:MAG: hypothetical protein Q9224_004693 [Gallowayella concinna]